MASPPPPSPPPAPPPPPPIAAGQVVQLKSGGGPLMCVESVSLQGEAFCSWWTSQGLQRNGFPVQILAYISG